MFFRVMILTGFTMLLSACSDEPSYVSDASSDIGSAINWDISGCSMKTYHKKSGWYVLCYNQDPSDGGALFRIEPDENDSDADGNYYFAEPITGKAIQFANKSSFSKRNIPIKKLDLQDASGFISDFKVFN